MIPFRVSPMRVLRYLPLPAVAVFVAVAFASDVASAAPRMSCGWHSNYTYEEWPFFFDAHAGEWDPTEGYFWDGSHAVDYDSDYHKDEDVHPDRSQEHHGNCNQ